MQFNLFWGGMGFLYFLTRKMCVLLFIFFKKNNRKSRLENAYRLAQFLQDNQVWEVRKKDTSIFFGKDIFL